MAEPRSPKLQRALLEVVHNQLRDGTPPETRSTLDRLVAGGYREQQGKPDSEQRQRLSHPRPPMRATGESAEWSVL